MKFEYLAPSKQVTDKSLGEVLTDIESRMPAKHVYKNEADKANWAHEATHYLNNKLRNSTPEKDNSFYLLAGRWVAIKEPDTTIKQVAAKVPQNLRDADTYNLYLVRSVGDWNNQPLYLCDEFSAYINGAACGIDLQERKLWKSGKRGAAIANMLEFTLYCTVLVVSLPKPEPILVDFHRFQISRALDIYRRSLDCPDFADPRATEYLNKITNSPYRQWIKFDYGTSEFL